MNEPTLNFHVQTNISQFKIPNELIKKNFKTIQKLIEKEKKQLTDDVSKIRKNPKLSKEMKLGMIQKIIRNFEGFQKKLKVAIERDQELQSRIIARIDHLSLLNDYCLAQDQTPITKSKGGKDGEEDGDDEDDHHDHDDEKEESTAAPPKDDNDKYLNLRDPNLINWYRDQTNLLIIDYLIKSNTGTGENIGLVLLNSLSESNPKYKKLIDYDLFENFNKVYVSIMEHHDLSLIIEWFSENKNLLKKLNSNLEFEINYCKFLSLIEKGDVNEAIKFSNIYLSPYGNKDNYQQNDLINHTNNFSRMKQIGGLLVYLSLNTKNNSNNTPAASIFANTANRLMSSSNMLINSPRFHEYEKLLSDERWESLSKCFIENFTKLYGISKNYPIFVYLSAGLSSLKTKSCYHNTENTIFRNVPATNETESTKETANDENVYKKDLAVLTNKKYRGPNQYYKLLNKINNCPVCSPELFKLSRNLPYAELITNIFDNPFKLPNGNIYPFDKLLNPSEKFLSEKNTLLRMNKIKDPLTREIFLIDNCVRVYPA
ncbi:CTLH/CRA C-terminal to lish motif domain-containing protein [Scheffersomyces coipomensis]|uniref:CTLH/CRA C-terminal to lish motif domain-containing protein n=1 Tax=Scheffersomyces coipomensis TaxID=1788519 RepID=UPI00315CE686